MTHRTIAFLLSVTAVYICLLASALIENAYLQLIVYSFGYILPFSVCLLHCRDAIRQTELHLLRPSRRIGMTTLTAFPFVFGCVLLCSMLSSLLLALSGASAAPIALTPLTFFRHALLSATLEEMVFRLLPLALFKQGERPAALLLSMITFSLFHLSGFRFLYAAVAGLLFFLVDLITESLLPSWLMHIGINTLSLLFAAITSIEARILFLCISGAAFLASGIILLMHRSDIKNSIKSKLNFT